MIFKLSRNKKKNIHWSKWMDRSEWWKSFSDRVSIQFYFLNHQIKSIFICFDWFHGHHLNVLLYSIAIDYMYEFSVLHKLSIGIFFIYLIKSLPILNCFIRVIVIKSSPKTKKQKKKSPYPELDLCIETHFMV